MSESDGPEHAWIDAHGHERVGMSEHEAAASIRAAGFRPTTFDLGSGGALAANQVPGSVTVFMAAGIVRRVRA